MYGNIVATCLSQVIFEDGNSLSGESCNTSIFNIIVLIYLLYNFSIIIINSSVDCLTLLFFYYFYLN